MKPVRTRADLYTRFYGEWIPSTMQSGRVTDVASYQPTSPSTIIVRYKDSSAEYAQFCTETDIDSYYVFLNISTPILPNGHGWDVIALPSDVYADIFKRARIEPGKTTASCTPLPRVPGFYDFMTVLGSFTMPAHNGTVVIKDDNLFATVHDQSAEFKNSRKGLSLAFDYILYGNLILQWQKAHGQPNSSI